LNQKQKSKNLLYTLKVQGRVLVKKNEINSMRKIKTEILLNLNISLKFITSKKNVQELCTSNFVLEA